ncbi:MAG: BlaI/MecI/CopY family transcriptional regulator [Candidatus Humimicrobiaceae bacterium]
MVKGNQPNKKNSPEYGINGITSISDLEVEIMKVIWKKEKTTVREVHEELLMKETREKTNGFTPYTTVMSVLSALTDKGILKRDKSAKTYLYSANVDQKELTKNIMKTVSDRLLDKASRELVSNFLSKMEILSIEDMEKFLEKL